MEALGKLTRVALKIAVDIFNYLQLHILEKTFCNSYLKVRVNSEIAVYPNVHFHTSEFEVHFVAFSDMWFKPICS